MSLRPASDPKKAKIMQSTSRGNWGIDPASRCKAALKHASTQTPRATSHMRLVAREHYTSSTLIGGKGGASPSLLHTTLEGPTEYVNTIWMLESTLIPT
jgi:hypothetical protein